MSTDRPKEQRVYQARNLAEIKPVTGIRPLSRLTFVPEIEISDETLEAVAGGGVATTKPDGVGCVDASN
jgi:hypothetical protein